MTKEELLTDAIHVLLEDRCRVCLDGSYVGGLMSLVEARACARLLTEKGHATVHAGDVVVWPNVNMEIYAIR